MRFVQTQYKGFHRGGRPNAAPPLWWRAKAATFVLALNKAPVLGLNTAHVLRLNKADVLALNKAHVGGPFVEAAEGRLLCVGCEHWAYLVLRRKTCALLRAKTSALLRRKTCPSSQHSTCLASQQGRCLGSQQRHMSHVSTLRYAQCSQPTQRRWPSAAFTKGSRPSAAPPLWFPLCWL